MELFDANAPIMEKNKNMFRNIPGSSGTVGEYLKNISSKIGRPGTLADQTRLE
jgi:hypothetical protein